MAGGNCGGFVGLRQGKRWGTVLLLIGQFAVGGSIALMAQWFQISGDPAGLFLAWGLSVLAMAVCLRHSLLATLAMGLLFFSINALAYVWVPFIAIPLVVAVAAWCRSRWVFFGGTTLAGYLAGGLVLEAAWDYSRSYQGYDFSMMYLALMGFYWAGSQLYARYQPSQPPKLVLDAGLDFAPIAEFKALVGLAGWLLFWSFQHTGYGWYLVDRPWPLWQNLASYGAGVVTLVFVGIAISLIGWLLKQHCLSRVELGITGIWVLSLLVLQLGALWGLSVIVYNLLVFAIGCLILWQGLQVAVRWRFWLGLSTLTLQILFRFFEYDTGLLLKALALIVCGVGVIILGIRFEQYSSRRLSTGV